MRRFGTLIGAVLLGIALVAAAQPGIFQPLPSVVQSRLAYSVAPPRQITVEVGNATLPVDLRGQGRLQLVAALPQAGSTHGVSAILYNLCTEWDLYGWYPGATEYQFRPKPGYSGSWQNFALHLDVPSLLWGKPIGTDVKIIPSAYFGSTAPLNERYAILPAPVLELGPAGMKGTVSEPYQLDITFPTLSIEWFRWSQTARLRAGNVVLHANVSWWWDATNVNAIHIGNLLIDLAAGTVTYIQPRSGATFSTLLSVTVDDGPEGFVVFEPDLWW
jgi:hypothetical protein